MSTLYNFENLASFFFFSQQVKKDQRMVKKEMTT